MQDIKLKDIVDRLYDPQSPITLEQKPFSNSLIQDITYNSEPIDILNMVWNTRFSRYKKNQDTDERNTATVLNRLYYSLEKRKQK